MGLTWAVGWAVAGILIGISSNVFPSLPWDSFFEVFDAPLPTLAIPGFFGGALFSIVLATAGRHRRFDELSLPRFAAWGALGGLLLSLLPAVMVAGGVLTGDSPHSLWQITAAISGPFTVLSAISASVSLLLARRAQGRSVQELDHDGESGSLPGGAARSLESGATRPTGAPLSARQTYDRASKDSDTTS